MPATCTSELRRDAPVVAAAMAVQPPETTGSHYYIQYPRRNAMTIIYPGPQGKHETPLTDSIMDSTYPSEGSSIPRRGRRTSIGNTQTATSSSHSKDASGGGVAVIRASVQGGTIGGRASAVGGVITASDVAGVARVRRRRGEFSRG